MYLATSTRSRKTRNSPTAKGAKMYLAAFTCNGEIQETVGEIYSFDRACEVCAALVEQNNHINLIDLDKFFSVLNDGLAYTVKVNDDVYMYQIFSYDEDCEDYNFAYMKGYERRCDQCKKCMNEGYVVDGGEEYYCSDFCLHQNYTPEEWLEMYDEGTSDSYWTAWEE